MKKVRVADSLFSVSSPKQQLLRLAVTRTTTSHSVEFEGETEAEISAMNEALFSSKKITKKVPI